MKCRWHWTQLIFVTSQSIPVLLVIQWNIFNYFFFYFFILFSTCTLELLHYLNHLCDLAVVCTTFFIIIFLFFFEKEKYGSLPAIAGTYPNLTSPFFQLMQNIKVLFLSFLLHYLFLPFAFDFPDIGYLCLFIL